MKKILLVCMGNICRSPIAHGVLNTLSEREGLNGLVQFDSAGTRATHQGEAPDQRAIDVAAARGYNISKLRARPVRSADFNDFDLILAMDRNNLATLQSVCPEQFKSKLALFLLFSQTPAPEEMPDPYYGSIAGFERVLDLCELAGTRLIKMLQNS